MVRTRHDWESPVATHIITAPDDDESKDGTPHETDGNLSQL
jgi:hypothetical protein